MQNTQLGHLESKKYKKKYTSEKCTWAFDPTLTFPGGKRHKIPKSPNLSDKTRKNPTKLGQPKKIQR